MNARVVCLPLKMLVVGTHTYLISQVLHPADEPAELVVSKT